MRALRELSEATGGSYAPYGDRAQLQQLLANLAYSDGTCSLSLSVSGAEGLTVGTAVQGEAHVGKTGARATFQFLAPPPR